MNLIAPFNAGYDAALEACGRNPADYQISVMVPVCVADSTDKAWEIAGPGIEYFVNFYQMRKNLQGEPASPDARITQEMLRTGNAGFWFAAVGTPDDVIGKLRPFVDGHLGRITQLALQMRQPGMSTADTHKSMRMFAHEVIPALFWRRLADGGCRSIMLELANTVFSGWSHRDRLGDGGAASTVGTSIVREATDSGVPRSCYHGSAVTRWANMREASKIASRSGAPIQKWSLPSTVISSTSPPASRRASTNSTLCACGTNVSAEPW